MLVPLKSALSFDDVRAFARACAERLVEAEPGVVTLEHRKANRGDRVLIDIFRNGYGQTAVPAYALRGRPGGGAVDRGGPRRSALLLALCAA